MVYRLMEIRILFDKGSQHSFITEEVAKRLNLKPIHSEHIAVAPFGAEHIIISSTLISGTDYCLNKYGLSPSHISPHRTIYCCTTPKFTANIYYRISVPSGTQTCSSYHKRRNFQISVLTGADFYQTFVVDHITGKG